MTNEEIKTQVDELLNKALILMESVPDAQRGWDDDSEVPRIKGKRLTYEEAEALKDVKNPQGFRLYWEGDFGPGEKEKVQLSATKSLLKILVKDNDAIHAFEQYYNSNC